MLDDIMGQSNAMQEKIQSELSNILISHEVEGVMLKGNATGLVTDISIDESLLTPDNKEMVEDLLLSCIQEVAAKANAESEQVSQKMLGDMLGGGFGNLFG